MNALNSYSIKVRTDVTSPVFSDGMVVTAGALNALMHYPVDLFQTLVSAFFGCGIVCGFGVERYPASDDASEEQRKWWLTIHPGMALDASGFPLRLSECQKLSLKPDPCSCDPLPEKVCIAVRRCVVPESPRDDADACAPSGSDSTAYRRDREYVEIKVFDPTDCDLPYLCKADPNAARASSECECLQACPASHCGESWVVLACVDIDPCDGITDAPTDCRKWVKPVHCACQHAPAAPNVPPNALTVSGAQKKKAVRKKAATKRATKKTRG